MHMPAIFMHSRVTYGGIVHGRNCNEKTFINFFPPEVFLLLLRHVMTLKLG